MPLALSESTSTLKDWPIRALPLADCERVAAEELFFGPVDFSQRKSFSAGLYLPADAVVLKIYVEAKCEQNRLRKTPAAASRPA